MKLVFQFQASDLRDPHLVVWSWHNMLKPFDLKTLALVGCDSGKVVSNVDDVELNTSTRSVTLATKVQVSGVWKDGGMIISMSREQHSPP